MKIVIQRVEEAEVTVDNKSVGRIGRGLLVFYGAETGDKREDCEKLAKKACQMRIFSDAAGKMSLSVRDIGGEVLAVSQFTLAANTKKGRRPDFTGAMHPKDAEEYFEYFKKCLKGYIGEPTVKSGIFAADMQVSLVNDGPVTIIVES